MRQQGTKKFGDHGGGQHDHEEDGRSCPHDDCGGAEAGGAPGFDEGPVEEEVADHAEVAPDGQQSQTAKGLRVFAHDSIPNKNRNAERHHGQAGSGDGDGFGVEGAVAEQQADDRAREGREQQRGWQKVAPSHVKRSE